MKFAIVCLLIGVLTFMAGYPVYDVATEHFSPKNLMIIIFAIGIASLMMTKENNHE